MANTRADLRTKVYERLGLPTTDGLITTTVVNSAINAALENYSSNGVWPWLVSEVAINTVAGTATYALPTNHVRTLYLLDTSAFRELNYRPRRMLASYGTLTGKPLYYCYVGMNLRLAPTPDGVYALTHGIRIPDPELTADGSIPLIPTQYSDYIVTIAARLLAVRLKDTELLNILRGEERAWEQRLERVQIQTSAYGRPNTALRGI